MTASGTGGRHGARPSGGSHGTGAPSAHPSGPVLLELTGVTKRFPGVTALDDVHWSVKPGEVHALVGENGAGKSTLVRTLCGVHAPDEGRMLLDGEAYAPTGPEDGLAAGIRVVYQEFTLLRHLSVAENLLIEELPRHRGLVDRRAMHRTAQGLLERVGLALSPSTLVEHLGIAQMQLLEIAKALAGHSRLLVLDEPTATLTHSEVESLFAIVADLRARGVSVVFISHHLEEVFAIADRVTVMRNGAVAATLAVSEVDVPELVRLMVGRSLAYEDVGEPAVPGPGELLRVEDLRVRGSARPVSFALREGEILGIAGLVGSGRTEVMRAIFGADARDGGTISVRGSQVEIDSPRDAVAAGVSLMTEDRKGQGLMLDLSVAANVSIASLGAVSRRGLMRRRDELTAAERYRTQLGVRAPSVQTAVGSLSGGNQQKVVLAKWLQRGTIVLIVDEPTRGVDVGAKFEIYKLLLALAAEGRGLIVVSSDLPELLVLCHRIAVFSRGEIAGEVARADFDQERILELAYSNYLRRPDQEAA